MVDAQNERTNTQGKRRGRRQQRGAADRELPNEQIEQVPVVKESAFTGQPEAFVRPAEITPPTEKSEFYCAHHLALLPAQEPMNTRTNMTSIRHLAVDHFGEATLYCDCLHNGPHEWPPSLQKLEIAIELDQFVTASSNDE